MTGEVTAEATEDPTFSTTIALVEGPNPVTVTAIDEAGREGSHSVSVVLDTGPRVSIDTSPFDLRLTPGETASFGAIVSFNAVNSQPYNILVTQQVAALSGPDGGISLSPELKLVRF